MTPKGESRGYPYMKISPYRWATQPRKGCPHHRGLQPLPILTRGVGSFTSHKNQIGQSAVRQDPFWLERLSVQILTESVCFLLAEQKCEKWTA